MKLEVKFNETNTRLAASFSNLQMIEIPGGGGTVEDLDAVLDAQEGLIDELKGILATKASGGKAAVIEPLEVTENGEYAAPDGVDGYSPVVVSVPIPDGYIQPEGALEVTENGAHDVTEYASVNVNVPVPDGYIMPSGSLEITENGTYNVTEKESVTVDVATGGGVETVEKLLTKTIEEYSNHELTQLGDYAFTNCKKLGTVDIPNVTTMGLNAFQNTGISIAEFSNLVEAGNFCFANCVNLRSVRLPSLQKGGSYLFSVSNVLERIDLLSVGSVGTSCFNACYVLTTLILRSTTLMPLANVNVFANCHHINGTKNNAHNPQGLKDGYIYVPKSLLSDDDAAMDYRRATNWATFASQFRALEDYTVDGTVTGELDPEKVGG